MSEVLNNPVAWLALVVSIASAVLAVWKIRRDLSRQESQDYLQAASRLLEQAFEAFDRAKSEQWLNLPEPSRLLWLTVARMIQESESTAASITERSHKILHTHARNFWRGRIYDLLLPLERVSLKYFAEDADSMLAVIGKEKRMPLAEKSLRVVLDFLQWPKDRSDPIGDIKDYTDQEIDRMRSFRYRPVADFLEASNVMASEDKNRQQHWRDVWNKAETPKK